MKLGQRFSSNNSFKRLRMVLIVINVMFLQCAKSLSLPLVQRDLSHTVTFETYLA